MFSVNINEQDHISEEDVTIEQAERRRRMSGFTWPTYPPCGSFPCVNIKCCSKGKYKVTWPDLVGKSSEEAKSIITKDNAVVTVVLVHKGEPVLDDFCCNRVWLYVDDNNRVTRVPHVG